VAFELALLTGGEVVSMDSMKVYRELEVATGKPSAERRAAVSYHLLDRVDPDRDFSAAEYLDLLPRVFDDIRSRGRTIILAGGTALYLKGHIDGFRKGPAPNWELRSRLLDEQRTEGAGVLHARLASLDPVAAKKIHPQDLRRTVRALEVLEVTGQALSARAPSQDWANKEHAGLSPRLFGLWWEREELYRRIDERVERMVAQGLFQEALRLQKRQPPLSRTASQAIGYKDIWESVSQGTPHEEAVQRIQRTTRRLAKSQLTWFRKLPLTWIPAADFREPRHLAEEILRVLSRSES
jgi:tRNA dimethylallyltransferase